MSIYASLLTIEDEREWISKLQSEGIDAGVIRDGDPRPEDLDAPFVYQGSHVLPQPNHPRGGSVSTAGIPAHVRFWRENPEADTEEEPELPWEPYMRLSVGEGGTGEDATVILNLDQVRRLIEGLIDWTVLADPTHGRHTDAVIDKRQPAG